MPSNRRGELLFKADKTTEIKRTRIIMAILILWLGLIPMVIFIIPDILGWYSTTLKTYVLSIAVLVPLLVFTTLMYLGTTELKIYENGFVHPSPFYTFQFIKDYVNQDCINIIKHDLLIPRFVPFEKITYIIYLKSNPCGIKPEDNLAAIIYNKNASDSIELYKRLKGGVPVIFFDPHKANDMVPPEIWMIKIGSLDGRYSCSFLQAGIDGLSIAKIIQAANNYFTKERKYRGSRTSIPQKERTNIHSKLESPQIEPYVVEESSPSTSSDKREYVDPFFKVAFRATVLLIVLTLLFGLAFVFYGLYHYIVKRSITDIALMLMMSILPFYLAIYFYKNLWKNLPAEKLIITPNSFTFVLRQKKDLTFRFDEIKEYGHSQTIEFSPEIIIGIIRKENNGIIILPQLNSELNFLLFREFERRGIKYNPELLRNRRVSKKPYNSSVSNSLRKN